MLNFLYSFNMPQKEVYRRLKSSGILYGYIIPSYDVLHTLSSRYLMEDLTDYMKEKGVLGIWFCFILQIWLSKNQTLLRRHPHPQYNRYKSEKNFKKFKIENGNIVWGKNWDLIFPIGALYAGNLEFCCDEVNF